MLWIGNQPTDEIKKYPVLEQHGIELAAGRKGDTMLQKSQNITETRDEKN